MMKRAIIATIALGMLLAACAPASSEAPDRLALPDLGGVESLQDLFNNEAGTTRLILILSPT